MAGVGDDGRMSEGTVSIVTGGASGIGRALVTELALRGGHVVVADIDEEGARRTCAVLAAEGARVEPAGLDVADAAAVRDLVRRVAAEHGALDLMVNNAGIAVAGPVAELTEQHWARALDINLRGVIHGSHAALEVMAAQPLRQLRFGPVRGESAGQRAGSTVRSRGPARGRILSTASLAGLIVAPGMLPYLTTKHAVVAFSRALALEARQSGVGVHALCPDFTDTPLLDQTVESPAGAGDFRASARSVQRRLGTPPDVARAALVGMDQGRVVIPVGTTTHVLWRLERALPAVFDRVSARRYRALPRP